MPRPQPYETYQGIPIFLYQEVGGKPNEWGASIRWQRQLIDVESEDGMCPTVVNMLAAAYRLVDVLKQGEERTSAPPGIKRTRG